MTITLTIASNVHRILHNYFISIRWTECWCYETSLGSTLLTAAQWRMQDFLTGEAVRHSYDIFAAGLVTPFCSVLRFWNPNPNPTTDKSTKISPCRQGCHGGLATHVWLCALCHQQASNSLWPEKIDYPDIGGCDTSQPLDPPLLRRCGCFFDAFSLTIQNPRMPTFWRCLPRYSKEAYTENFEGSNK